MVTVIAIAALIALLAARASAAAHGITRHDRNVVRFFQHHPRLAHTAAGGKALAAVLPDVVRSLQAVPRPPWPVPPTAWMTSPNVVCIRVHESGDGTASSNVYGMLQGWRAAGGDTAADGYASAWSASRAEQDYRAYVLWRMDGWGPWITDGCF